MKNKQKQESKKKEEKDITLKDFFRVVDTVAQKAIKDTSSKKIIDSAAQKWEIDSRYAF